MKKLILSRIQSLPDRMLGNLAVFDGLTQQGKFVTLELPWKDNKRQESCIPAGKYIVEPRTSEKHGKHLFVRDVPGRDMILFHSGNWPKDSLGCILAGLMFSNIDKSPAMEISSSQAAMGILVQLITSPAELHICNCY